MRKWIALLLLCCLLSGCSAASVERVPEQRPLSSTAPAMEEPAEEAACICTVEMTDWEDSAVDDDGTVLAACRVHIPHLTVRRGDGAAIETGETEREARALAAAETFNGEFDPWTEPALLEELEEAARAELAWRREAEIPWDTELFTELDCRVYETGRLVSVAGTHYSFTGGAHPNTVLMAWNFDLETGEFFAPEQLAEDGAAFSETVRQELVRQIVQRAEENGMAAEEMYWSNYEEVAAGWSSYAVSFDEAGMTVAFSPYELAAYAAGPQSFLLPYELLRPCLSDYGRGVLFYGEE